MGVFICLVGEGRERRGSGLKIYKVNLHRVWILLSLRFGVVDDHFTFHSTTCLKLTK